jgi:hypothetical protein
MVSIEDELKKQLAFLPTSKRRGWKIYNIVFEHLIKNG